MKIEKKILWAISLSALSLCTYNQPVLASDTDVEILNYVDDQRREARDKEKNKAINDIVISRSLFTNIIYTLL